MSSPEDPKFWESLLDRGILLVIGVGALLTALGNFRKKLWKAVKWMFTEDESGADRIVAAIAKGFADSNANTLAVNQATSANLKEVLARYGYDVQAIKSAQERMREDLERVEGKIDAMHLDLARRNGNGAK